MRNKMARVISNYDRELLFKEYKRFDESVYEIKNIIRHMPGYEEAKAYWFGNLSGAINDEEFFSNSHMRKFLQENGIMDEEDNFIDRIEEEEDNENQDSE